jgi:hypothetical protein
MFNRVDSSATPTTKRSYRLLALLLIGGGMAALLQSTGLVSAAAWSVLWPLALIALGFDLVTEGVQRRRIMIGTLLAALFCLPIVSVASFFESPQVEQESEHGYEVAEAFEGIEELQARVNLTAGSLSIRDMRSSGDHVVELGRNGQIARHEQQDRRGILEIGTASLSEEDLNLRFQRELPLDLAVDIGTGNAETLDFEHIALKRLDLTIGAGNAELIMPEQGTVDATITISTLGHVEIEVPDNMPARIVVNSSLSNPDINDRFKQQQDGAYVSEGYDSDASNRITITINSTAGNINVD